MAYYYFYVEGIKYPPTIRLLFGDLIHQILEIYFRNKVEGETLECSLLEDLFVKYLDEMITTVRWVDGENHESEVSFYKEKGIKLIRKFYPLIETLKPIEVEKLMHIPIIDGGFEITIKPDLIIEDGVIDFKTKQRKTTPDFNQLLLYSLGYKQLMGKYPRHLTFINLIYTKKQEKIDVVSIDGHPKGHPDLLIKEVKTVLDSIQRGIYFPAPPNSWQCSPEYCDYFEICPYGKRRQDSFVEIEPVIKVEE